MSPNMSPNIARRATLPRPAISVVVPVRNEAGNIAPLVAEIAAALQATSPGRAFEIVYVNDGSCDATDAELRG